MPKLQIWKFQPDDPKQLANIRSIRAITVRLQNHLCQAASNFQLDLSVRVMGNVEDLRHEIGNMMENMDNLEMRLSNIEKMSSLRQQSDELIDLSIQMQRGFEHYERQVALGNIQRNINFEERVESCQNEIENVVKIVSYKRKVFGTVIETVKIEPWMLSSDDVHFDPNDLSTAVGRGGYATVYKGTYQGQPVAVKRFDQIFLTDSTDLEKIITKEVKAWKSVSHEQYILTLVGMARKDHCPILVCELCQTNILRYVRDWPDALLPVIYHFARGLTTLHKANIIHRDLKGDNVLVSFEKNVAIADFGLSRTVTSLENTKTRAKRAGTLNWMSPEQYLKPRRVTTKSDVWSFGMSVWEVLCDDTPFRGCSEAEFEEDIYQCEDDRPEKPHNLHPDLEPLWTLITKCWQLDPSARSTADDIVEFLDIHYGSQL